MMPSHMAGPLEDIRKLFPEAPADASRLDLYDLNIKSELNRFTGSIAFMAVPQGESREDAIRHATELARKQFTSGEIADLLIPPVTYAANLRALFAVRDIEAGLRLPFVELTPDIYEVPTEADIAGYRASIPELAARLLNLEEAVRFASKVFRNSEREVGAIALAWMGGRGNLVDFLEGMATDMEGALRSETTEAA